MALSEPSWRIKSRPCPFYQRQRCLFNDSCNFIHAISAKPVLEGMASTISLQDARTPRSLPRVVVDSPSAVLSPDRSPRTRGLLLALKDVIGDPDEGISSYGSTSSAWSESFPTLVNKDSFEQTYVGDADDLQEYDPVEEANWTVLPDELCALNISSSHESFEALSSSPIAEDASREDATIDEANWTAPPDYANPLGISTSLSQGSTDILSSSMIVEDETVKLSNITNDSDGPLLEPTSSSSSFIKRYSERSSGLLSPIEIATLDLGPFRLSRAHSFTVTPGAADWKQPSPLQPSPPRSPSIASSMVEMLASPFGSHATRILSPRLSVFLSPNLSSLASPLPDQEIEPLDLSLDSPAGHSIPAPAPIDVEDITTSWNNRVVDWEDDGSSCDDREDEEDFILGETCGGTPIWNTEYGQASPCMGVDAEAVRDQVTDAIKRASRTPTHFLGSNISFSENETAHSSLVLDDTDGEDACVSLRTVLTGLGTGAEFPSVRAEGNDTLNSFYDIYSGFASPQDILADSIRNAHLSPLQPKAALSNVSTLASSSRERVFTPPSSSSRHTANAKTIDSTPSSLTSMDSVSGRGSPFSQHGHGASTVGVEKYATKPTESRKIPIASRSRSKRSQNSISSNQCSTKSVPFSPRSKDIKASPSCSVSSIDSSRMKGLKPLRLSTNLSSQPLSRSLFESRISASFANSFPSRNSNRVSNSSASVSSSFSLSNNRLFSSPRSPGARNHPITSELEITPNFRNKTFRHDEPLSAPLPSRRDSIIHPSRLSEPAYECEGGEDDTVSSIRRDFYDETIRRRLPHVPHTAPAPHMASNRSSYAVETTRPTLMFAIASDNVEQVKRALESGGVNPNEAVGPQSALAFTLTNDKLTNKLEIVKTLLAYGADPKSVPASGSCLETTNEDETAKNSDTKPVVIEHLDYATRYYLERADAMYTKRSSALIQRSFFRPLTRVRYELVGQDRALEQLFRVLSMRSRELTVAPIVVMLCGPSGHGKSLLARKFGSLLEVPAHTVNMTTLRSSHDLWQSLSMSPYEEPSNSTLAEFLINNEGQKCVVILDEIEKIADEKILWSLYLPWELGRCAIESSGRQVDVRNVIWLGTSNIGHDLIFQYEESRRNPGELMSREEYLEVMSLLRPKVSERLGASVLSRVSTVLPFVPFTLQEKKAICTEALYTLGDDACHSLDKASVESIIDSAITNYYPAEGARSLHRAISNQLLDIL